MSVTGAGAHRLARYLLKYCEEWSSCAIAELALSSAWERGQRQEPLAGGVTAVEWCDSVGFKHRASSNGQEGVLINVIDPDERITCFRTRGDGHLDR